MSTGLFPGSPAPAVVVMPRPMVASAPSTSTTPNLSGVIDGVSTKIAVIPGADLQSGIIVKAAGPTWGGMAAGGSPDYGKGQFISFHKWGTGLSDSPNNTLMFRVDKTGGLGLTGGVHIATGLRQDVGYSVTQAVWINPNLDTTFVAMTGVAGQTLPFLYASNSTGSMLFEVFASGAVQSAADIAARIGTAQQIAVGNVAGFPSIQFGNDSTTFLARTSVSTYLQVTNHLQAVGELIAEVGQTDKQVVIGTMFGTAAGIGFGTAVDAVIARTFPGLLQASSNFHVKNTTYPATAVLTLQNAASQTGKAIRGLNSAGTEIWSIDANGILSTVSGGFPPTSGNWTMKDSLIVQNAGAAGTTVLAAIGVAGQTAPLISANNSGGGSVWSVSNGGAVSAAGAVSAGAGLSGTTGTFTGAVTSKSLQATATTTGTVALAGIGLAGQSASLIAAVNSGGGTVFSVSNAGAVSANSVAGGTISGSSLNVGSGGVTGGAGTFTSLNVSGTISGNQGTGGAPTLASRTSGHTIVWDYTGTSLVAYVDGSAGFGWSGGLAKSFVIDHPCDVDRLLVHACTEGPEATVFYRGEAEVGADGSVVVELPDYFEALTLDEGRTVQLTPICENVALAHRSTQTPLSATRPHAGSFLVVGEPGVRFFWRVEAVRADIEALQVEPHRRDVTVYGEGPYTYLGGAR